MKPKEHMPDPLEAEIEQALTYAEIAFIRESEGSKFLDFFLPEYGVYIEVKGGSTPRIAEQCERDHNVIVIQGVKSTKFIVEMLEAMRARNESRDIGLEQDLLS